MSSRPLVGGWKTYSWIIFFGELEKGDRTHGVTWQFLDGRDELIAFLGRAISRLSTPTYFVRDQDQPVHSISSMQTLEFQRGETDATFNAVQIATCLISIGLEVAVVSTVELKLRQGVASDYVHWAGRLMRSDAARIRLAFGAHASDLWMNDFAFLTRPRYCRPSRYWGSLCKPQFAAFSAESLVPLEFKTVRSGNETTARRRFEVQILPPTSRECPLTFKSLIFNLLYYQRFPLTNVGFLHILSVGFL